MKKEVTKIDVIPKYKNLSKSGYYGNNKTALDDLSDVHNSSTLPGQIYGKSSTRKLKSKSELEEDHHEVHPIKWVLTSLNQ